MVKHIVIVSDRQRDNISVYTEEPAFVVLAERTDLNALKQLAEANRAGIYILIGENKRYIGQSATSVYSRLSLHHKNIDWWNQVVFFGREDGHLDKSQTDYLEAKLIEEFQQTNFHITNSQGGNSSWIDKTSKIHAQNIWTITQDILENVANINLFDQNEQDRENGSQKVECTITFQDKVVAGKNPGNNQIEFFTYLLNHPQYSEPTKELIVNGKPNSRHLLGTEVVLDKNGRPRCIRLDDNIYLYTNLSTKDRRKAIQRFISQLGFSVKINW